MAKKILIIEDQAQLRFMIALTLRYRNYEPLEAEDGYAGIKTSLVEQPDLILLDLGLPGMGGIDTAKKIKENPHTRHIPIIALTGWEPSRFEAKAQQAGIAAYLQKPVALTTITEQIESLIRSKSPQLFSSIGGRALTLQSRPSRVPALRTQ